MSAQLLPLAAHGLALALTLGAMATALGALLARSLVSMAMYFAASAALAGGAVLALGAGDAALAWVLIGFCLAPVIVLAVLLLSVRIAKARARTPMLTIIAALAAGVAILWAAGDVGVAAAMSAPSGNMAPWLAALLFVATAACVGLMGYGERGALQRPPGGDE